jgi:hypothetical protein
VPRHLKWRCYFAKTERLANVGKTLAAGRVAELGQYRAEGFDNAGRWLAARAKASAWEAGKTLDTARHVADPKLTLTRDAFVAGRLTATQANEIASAAAKAPDQQDRLLALARRETVTQLKNACRAIRLARKRPEKPKEQHDRIVGEMAFGSRPLGDDLSELCVRMPTSWLVVIQAAVQLECDDVFARAKAEGRNDPHHAYMVEALMGLILFDHRGHVSGNADPDANANSDGATGSDDVDTGDASDGELGDDGLDSRYDELLAALDGFGRGARPNRQARRKRRGRCRCGGRVVPKAKIIIRVDQSALLRGHAIVGELCDIAGVGPVEVKTVRELWPDAILKLVITDGIAVRNVTHLGRKATEAMETAMQFQNPLCSNIACDNQRFVQIDHRLGFANVHRTCLDELDPLCTHCHALKTNHNWQLATGRGRRAFVPPGHPDHPGHPPTSRRPARPAGAAATA